MKGLVCAVSLTVSLLPLLSALHFTLPLLSGCKATSSGPAGAISGRSSRLKMSSFDDEIDDAIGAPVGPLPSVSRCE